MKRRARSTDRPALSRQRLIRLFRFVKLLERTPLKREHLMKRLHLDVRGFYRDLEALRELGIVVAIGDDHRYSLQIPFGEALKHLPFPTPQLTFSEVAELIQSGSGTTYDKLRKEWETLFGERATEQGGPTTE